MSKSRVRSVMTRGPQLKITELPENEENIEDFNTKKSGIADIMQGVLLERIISMEYTLKDRVLPLEKAQQFQKELKQLHNSLIEFEEKQEKLHGHKRQLFVFAGVLLFICFLVYGVYMLNSEQEL